MRRALPLLALLLPLTAAAQPERFADCEALPENAPSASILFQEAAFEFTIEAGDQLAAFTPEGRCAGLATWTDTGVMTLTVAGDDPVTPAQEGFEEGDRMTLAVRFPDQAPPNEYRLLVVYAVGSGEYRDGGVYLPSSVAIEGVLPVELTTFEAVVDGEVIHLVWRTASETNNAGFFVEVAKEPPEGTAVFEEAGFVAGAGWSTEPRTYSFVYRPEFPGEFRFRLRQVDHDGAATYGPTILVAYNPGGPYLEVFLVPNPAVAETKLMVAHPPGERVRYYVFNSLGRFQTHGVLGGDGTFSSRSIDVTNWPAGVYLVRVAAGNQVNRMSLIVVR